MLLVGLRIGVTGDTSKNGIVSRSSMAINTLIPFASVFSAIDWKILVVVVKGGRNPRGFAMTGGTIQGELRCDM